jgi:hypothetical protein
MVGRREDLRTLGASRDRFAEPPSLAEPAFSAAACARSDQLASVGTLKLDRTLLALVVRVSGIVGEI